MFDIDDIQLFFFELGLGNIKIENQYTNACLHKINH